MLYIFLRTISKSKHKCYREWFVWCLSSYIVMARTMFWLWYRGGGLSLGLWCLTPLSTIFQLYRGWTRFSCITSGFFLSFIVCLFVCLFVCFFVCFVLHRSYFCFLHYIDLTSVFLYYIDLTSVFCITSILLLFCVLHRSYFCFLYHMDRLLLCIIGRADVKYLFGYLMLKSNVVPLHVSVLEFNILIINVIRLICVYGLTILYTDV